MNKNSIAFPWLGTLTVGGILIFNVNQVLAQVTPDNTLGDESSVVNTRDATNDSIDGGAIRGQNLFHSFEEFNVGEDRGVYFANPDDVTNIFSRVTGNNVSNILGTLGVDGAANLFLINPNGIVFGEGASLDVQGSFAATTADGIEFGEQGFFGVSNPESPKLLTINPSAYLFNQVAPGAIANSSQASADSNPATSFDDGFFGLRVPDGQNLLLLGGDVSANGGGLVASGGRIDLGAVTGEGVIGINNNGSLNIPDSISRGNVSLTNGAGFLVAGDGGGDIAIAAKNISLDSDSTIDAGIYSNFGSPNAQAGDIIINATGTISVKDDDSYIVNSVFADATGTAGNLTIDTNDLIVSNGGQIGAVTFGQGDGGNLTVRASNIELEGASSDGQFSSGLFTTVESQAQGNGGNLTINTDNLSLRDRAQVSGSTLGQGDAGNILVNATDRISLDNESTINSNIEQGAVGNGGQIEIDTNTLDLTNGGQVLTIVREAGNNLPAGQGNAGKIAIDVNDSLTLNGRSEESQFSSAIYSYLSTGAKGKAGNLEINTRNLVVQNSGEISSSTFGQGNSGNIFITADNSISLDADSTIVNNVQSINAVGDAGKINITTGSLSAKNGSQINSFTRGRGNAGDITIQATDSVTFDGFGSDGLPSGLLSNVEAGAVGNGGNINLKAGSLSLTNGGQLEVSVFGEINALAGGEGQSGSVSIDVNDTLTIAGENTFGIFANLGVGAKGSGGDIDIQAENLVIKDGGTITASTLGQGDSGNLSITADNSISLDGSDIANNVEDINAVGNGGNINLKAGSLSLTNDSAISTGVLGQGNAGRITIATDSLDLTNNSFINTSILGQGNAGKITIATDSLDLTSNSFIDASTLSGQGNAGGIDIQVSNTTTLDKASAISSSVNSAAIGNAGGITINSGSLNLTASSAILTGILGQGDAGGITINSGSLNLTASSAILASLGDGAVGSGGDINIQTGNLVVENGGQISASTLGKGDSGNLSITADNSISLDADSTIVNNVQSIDAVGDAGKIKITTGSLLAKNGSQINSFTRGQGNAGDITIQATDAVTFGGVGSNSNGLPSGSLSSVEAGGKGNGGNLTINTDNLSLRDRAQISASNFGVGNAGKVVINATNNIALDNESTISSNVEQGAVGNGGQIEIDTNTLDLTNGGQVLTIIREARNNLPAGQGNAGKIAINVNDSLTLNGRSEESQFSSAIYSYLSTGAKGKAGNLEINTGNLIVQNSGEISSSTFGQGNSGNIFITADNSISLDADSTIVNNVQ
ncbi:MAG: filamentous hemagglutinin N-terminal domain-containing protein, partial [Pleurocapsa sp. CRU_1_2]|nr:filamentous hemagglutinin N-terminal domain-containing protein [Pleurocapsa sp. CRU_1_2]